MPKDKFVGCRGFDPIEDTERLYLGLNSHCLARVAGDSIRLRILKAHEVASWLSRGWCCRGFDPIEDTERFAEGHRGRVSCCCRGFDPIEDTESTVTQRDEPEPIQLQGIRSD